jgi:TRAP-type C4-dicarboxylate transport system permease large subunit
VLGASILGNAAAFLGIPQAVAAFVKGLGLSPFMLIVVLIIFYLILGCFLDGFSMIVMTLPIVLPIVKGAGFDEIWFGIFLVLAVEMAQITPPVGFNLFVIQGLTEDGLGYIARVTLPYLMIMIGFVLLLTLWPGIVTILPRVLYGYSRAAPALKICRLGRNGQCDCRFNFPRASSSRRGCIPSLHCQ